MERYKRLTRFRELFSSYNFTPVDGELQISVIVDESLNRLLETCDSNQIPVDSISIGELYIDRDELSLYFNKHAVISLNSSDLRGLGIYWGWEEFLRYKPNLTNIPSEFFIISKDVIYPCERPTGELKHYLEICQFLKILIGCADYTQQLSQKVINELLFLHKSKIEITIEYSMPNLQEGLDGISVIVSMFEDGSHKEQKISILKEVIYNLLSNVNKKERLQYLFTNFGEFSKRLNENYQLFVSEFSFDEVRKEYEEKKRDYLSKLNDIFSSVHTKMLGIPISLALASLKIELITDKITFATNIFVFIAITIYTNMMYIIINNQKHTLNAIKNEYESQMARMKHHYVEQYENIKNIQIELDERYRFHKRCLNSYHVMSMGVFFVGLILFCLNIPWETIFSCIFS